MPAKKSVSSALSEASVKTRIQALLGKRSGKKAASAAEVGARGHQFHVENTVFDDIKQFLNDFAMFLMISNSF